MLAVRAHPDHPGIFFQLRNLTTPCALYDIITDPKDWRWIPSGGPLSTATSVLIPAAHAMKSSELFLSEAELLVNSS